MIAVLKAGISLEMIVTMQDRPKTIICDIDGVLLKHTGNITKQHLGQAEVLPGVPECLKEWDIKGYRIVLLTGRRESTRAETERQLTEAGIFFDQLIMGVTGGVRVLINDCKPNSTVATAEARTVLRNAGISDLRDL